jgi:hypothetical protein
MQTNSTPSKESMATTVAATLRRAVIDRIAQEIFHADVLDGNTERSATWAGTTDADRHHYRARARRELRQQDRLALDAAMHRAKQAAWMSLPASVRMFIVDDGRKQFDTAIECAIAAREAQLLHGREEQELQDFEQLAGIPAAKPLTLVPREIPVLQPLNLTVREIDRAAFGLDVDGTTPGERWAQRNADSGDDGRNE